METLGFHGNAHLLSIVKYLANLSSVYIETGTHMGSTFYYVVRTYPHLFCLGCEPARGRFDIVYNKVKKFDKAHIFNETSQKFMKRIHRNYLDVLEKPSLLWIDAHSKLCEWPLKKEVAFFTKYAKAGFILIDDFLVPNQRQFRYNKYGKQKYTFKYIKEFIDSKCVFYSYYPKYKKEKPNKTLTGWVLLQTDTSFGRLDNIFPDLIEMKKE